MITFISILIVVLSAAAIGLMMLFSHKTTTENTRLINGIRNNLEIMRRESESKMVGKQL